jgi:hypothetical protein
MLNKINYGRLFPKLAEPTYALQVLFLKSDVDIVPSTIHDPLPGTWEEPCNGHNEKEYVRSVT